METERKLPAKKEWQTPELIVLVRSKPQESVLGSCKHFPTDRGSATAVEGCMFNKCLNICYSLADIT
jgi:hypothetical protein